MNTKKVVSGYRPYAIFALIFIIWCGFVTYVFNIYAYPINQFNAKVRLWVVKQNINIREFDEEGFPISHSPKIGKYISPFYIVHYGLIYSQMFSKDNAYIWRRDPSIDSWNVPPQSNSNKSYEKYFYNMATWLVENRQQFKGESHYLYNYDWPYENYHNNMLEAPWWSGLTDGYAIIVLLRAYDHFGDIRFLSAARELYESVLTPIHEGGSLNKLNGCPWIEEYVDPKTQSDKMAFVLNGMIYAAYGVEAYELYKKVPDKEKIHSLLYSCIEKNITAFDLNGWSSYDLIGTPANIKYHKVHYQLLKSLNKTKPEIFNSTDVIKVIQSWRKGIKNPGFYFILKGPVSMAYFHFLAMYFSFILAPLIFSFFLLKLKRKPNGL